MKTIRDQILLTLLGGGMLLIIVILAGTLTITMRKATESAFGRLVENAEQLERKVELLVDSAARDLSSLQTDPELTDPSLSIDAQSRAIERLSKAYSNFSDLTLYRPDGLLKATTDRAGGPKFNEKTRWFKHALGGRTALTPPNRVLGREGLFLNVYLPIKSAPTNELLHVVVARMPILKVESLISGFQLGAGGKAVLLDGRGKVLASSDESEVLERFDRDRPVGRWKAMGHGVYQNDQGESQHFGVAVLERGQIDLIDDEWVLLCIQPTSEVRSAVYEAARIQCFTGVVVMIIMLVVGWWLACRITDPLVEAAEVATIVGRGQVAARIDENGPEEVIQLASAFNKMADEVSCHREELESLVDSRTKKLRESQGKLEEISAQLRAAFESTREAILIVRHDGVVITANRRIKEYFGLSNQEMTWAKFDDFRESLFDCFADRAGFEEAWESAELNPDFTCDGEWEIVGPEPRVVFGYSVPVRNQSGEAFAHLWTFEDITKERELQRGLEQAQKMEAVGRLAGGVAHDFNNLLTGIIGNLSLVEMAAGGALAKSGASKYIVTAKQAGERAADLVKQLLGFSRKSHLTLEHCDVNGIVAEVRDLLSHTLDPRIRIESDIESGLWGVKVDPTQVQQVVMNMCVNAKDALGESGIIRLHTENVHVDQVEASQHDAQSGDYVKLCVADDGQGIPPEILDKVFEPFFTTKEPGKGTGLGLATCYGIVQQHGGWIECDSEVGSGTTFSIFLPRREQETVEEKAVVAPVEQPTVGGSEAILLVDDDIVVRGVAECVLKHHGYEVVCASDGREAVESVRERGEDFSLVLLDLTMPNISGKDAFKMIKDMYPEMKVLFCSGYMLTYEEFEKDGGYRPEGFVQKPYDIGTLAASVRSTIDDDAPVAVKESVEA